nr:cuticle protein AM/CP1114-like [Cherax quadricarinatus]
MQLVIFAALVALAASAPRPDSPEKTATILRDDRITEDDGRYNFEVETSNGIVLSQSGSPVAQGAIGKSGQYSFTSPEGVKVTLKFVADENGYKPESPFLPVAPEFPHPVPDYVLRQIEFAAAEDAARARGEKV